MNFYAFSALLNGLAATALGSFVYSRDRRNPRHRAFGLYCLSLSIWSYFYLAWQLTESKDLALLFVRLLMGGAILIPVFYLYHALTLLDRVQAHRRILGAGYILSAVFLLLDCTPYFVADLQPKTGFPYWPKPGIAFHFYLAWFAVYVLYATYLFIESYRQAKGLRRNQCLYLLLGSVIGYAGGATNFLLWYDIQIPPNGTILIAVYTAIVAYTMVRYRLFDLTVAMEKGLTILLLLTLIAAPSYIILEIAQKVYFGELNYQFSIILLALLTLIVIVAYKLKTEAQTAIARTLFRHRYDMYETLSEFSKALVTILDLRSLTEEIVGTLANIIGIKTASLYLLDKEKAVYSLSSSHGLNVDNVKVFRLSARDDLPSYLTGHQAILVREELEHTDSPGIPQSILGTLAAMESEVCIPLVNKDRLIGFCNLGARHDSGMYSAEDLNLLITLAHNAAIALDNAILYEDLRRSYILMRRTDRLRSLETIAGGFAHEIRNPLTSIKTFVQLAPMRRDDPEFMGGFSKVVAEDLLRIERLIQEILDYARYMEPKFSKQDLNDVVASCLYFVEVKAEGKSIVIEKDLAKDLPPVLLDRQQIKQILLNLFLNAMEAMADGGGRLTVKTHRLTKSAGDLWAQIEVADTGPGIEADVIEHIFDPFYTTKHQSEEREGTGLGLTIVHQIVQEHRGYIEVESEAGSGTTFFVNLPVNPLQSGRPKAQQDYEKANSLSR
jgi:signal transduction histidine kinase